jgi:hypothetical protein
MGSEGIEKKRDHQKSFIPRGNGWWSAGELDHHRAAGARLAPELLLAALLTGF